MLSTRHFLINSTVCNCLLFMTLPTSDYRALALNHKKGTNCINILSRREKMGLLNETKTRNVAKDTLTTPRDKTCLKTNISPHKLLLPLSSMLARHQQSRDHHQPIRTRGAVDRPISSKQWRGLTNKRCGGDMYYRVLVSRLLICRDQSHSGW